MRNMDLLSRHWIQRALLATLLAPLVCLAQPETIRQYQLQPRADGQMFELALEQVVRPEVGPNDVLVRVHATSLNGGYDLVMLNASPERRPDLAGGIPSLDAHRANALVEVELYRFGGGGGA